MRNSSGSAREFLKFTTVTQGHMNKSAETTKYYLAVKLYNRNVLYAANKNSHQVSHFTKILV